jgi:uncharacterized transporter YbjL
MTLDAIRRGVLYGLLNTLIVGMLVGIAVLHSAAFAILMMVFGVVPGMVAGLLAGALAGALAHQPPWLRAVAVLAPAHVVLLSVAALTPVGYALAFVPTTILALTLEERTRGERNVIPRAIVAS